ncbi:MAG: ABC transporter ATP-binding protein [Thermodesulfobacteriota bacterium]
MQSYRLLFPYLRQGWVPLLFGILFLFSVDFLQLSIPRFIKGAIDALTSGSAAGSRLIPYVLGIIAAASLIFLFRMFWRRLIFGQGRRVEEALRNRLFAHLLSLSQSYYQRTSIGDLMAHATNDMEAVRMAMGMGLVSLLDALVLGSAAIAFMAYINPQLTLISLWPMPLAAFLTQRLSKMLHQRFEKVQGTFALIMEKVRESLAGILVIKAYTLEAREEAGLARLSQDYQDQNIALARVTSTLFPMSVLLTNLSLVVVLWVGGRQVLDQEITTGDFVAFISYLQLLTWPVTALGWGFNLIKRGAVSLARIERVLSESPEIADRPGVIAPPAWPRPELRVESLSFSYPGEEKKALEGISLDMKPGRFYIISGKTGSGKTTLALLLVRLLDPFRGKICLNGQDLRQIPLGDLRKTVSLVPQEPFLFSDTIRANLLLVRPEAEEGQLWEVLKVAALEEEVRTFPQGLDTVVGEKGVLLSGGQKQRLSLARALLANPALLILDNTLSSVDLNTEFQIRENLKEFKKDRTLVFITHRLVGWEDADEIFFLESGKVVEQGEHEHLLDRDGPYARLYRYQLLEMELRQGKF